MNVNDLPFLPVVYLNKLVEVMAEERIQAEYILRDCGISHSILTKPEAFLTAYQIRAVVSHYLGLTVQSHPAIRYGQRLDLVTHGLFGYVFSTRLPFHDMMTRVLHYLQVRFPLLDLTLINNSEFMAIRLAFKHSMQELEAFVIKAFLSSLYTLVSLVTKNISLHFQPHILNVNHNAEQLLPVPIETGCLHNEIRFYATETYPRIPQNPSQTIPPHAPDPFYEHSLVVRMRAYILTRIDEGVSADDAAQHLNMSVRTLRRRLADLGMSFNDVRLEVRMQAAMRYLKISNLSLERIATQVGYSDQASFTRAFQKWAGETPDVVRRKHRRKFDTHTMVPLATPHPLP